MNNQSSRKHDRRVVICGYGAVTPLGLAGSEDSLWLNLIEGRTAIRPFEFDPCDFNISARVSSWISQEDSDPYSFNMKDYLELIPFPDTNPKLFRADLSIQLGVAAASLAYEHAGLSKISNINDITGVSAATGLGGGRSFNQSLDSFRLKGKNKAMIFTVPNVMPNAVGGTTSIVFGLQGPSTTITTACASGNYAICDAADKIKLGHAEVMVVVGAEAMAVPFMIASFDQLGALSHSDSTYASKPFSNLRDGFVMGEGGGALVLADFSYAEKHGLPIIAELIGYATNSGANDIVQPSIEGATRCMEAALDMARISNGKIDYVNAHGTSTPEGDPKEAEALWNVFADRNSINIPKMPLINSSKSLLGHTLGAAGIIEAVITLKTLETGIIHPMKKLHTPDYPLDPVCLMPQDAYNKTSINPYNLALPIVIKKTSGNFQIAMSNSFGFGDHNSVVIFKKL